MFAIVAFRSAKVASSEPRTHFRGAKGDSGRTEPQKNSSNRFHRHGHYHSESPRCPDERNRYCPSPPHFAMFVRRSMSIVSRHCRIRNSSITFDNPATNPHLKCWHGVTRRSFVVRVHRLSPTIRTSTMRFRRRFSCSFAKSIRFAIRTHWARGCVGSRFARHGNSPPAKHDDG